MAELLSLFLAKILPFEVHKNFQWLSFLFLLAWNSNCLFFGVRFSLSDQSVRAIKIQDLVKRMN